LTISALSRFVSVGNPARAVRIQGTTFATNRISRATQSGCVSALRFATARRSSRIPVMPLNPQPGSCPAPAEACADQKALTDHKLQSLTLFGFFSIKITGVKNLVGANGEDAVTEVTKTSFLPLSPESFTHDADGNLTDDARWHYTWDGENRLIAMETATGTYAPNGPLPATDRKKLEFAYDGMGRRFSKKVYSWTGSAWMLGNSTLFLYDGWNLLADLNALNSNAVVCTYAWGLDLSGSLQGAGGVGGLLFASSSALSSPLHAPCFDGNGNVIGYVDMASGAKSATYEYNAFGETTIADGSAKDAFSFRFSTKYQDNETGLYCYGFRYYSGLTGRWLSRDPAEEDGGTNLYGFVDNDGINSVDFLGLWITVAHEAIADYWLQGLPSKSKCGCCGDVDTRDIIKAASARADGFVGIKHLRGIPNLNPFSLHSFYRQQSAKHANEHAMSYPGEPTEGRESAPERYNAFVTQKIQSANSILASLPSDTSARCKAIKRAIEELGYAFHDITDDHSPKHENYQQWRRSDSCIAASQRNARPHCG
jgi:RHS repeat-associated protein